MKIQHWFLALALVGVLPVTASADANDGGQIKILKAGAEPKQALRYTYKKGQKSTMTLESDMSMEMSIGDKSMPKMTLPTISQRLRMEVTGVDKDGNAEFKGLIDNVKVAAAAAPEMKAALEKELKNMNGTKVTGKFSPRGQTLSLDVKLGKDASDQAKQQMEGIVSSLRQLMTVLPTEAVGTGAVWENNQVIKLNFGTANQKTKYEIKSLKGGAIELAASMDQTAAPQKVALPGAPPGAEAQLTSLKGTGNGTTKFDLAKLGVAGNMNAAIKVALSAQGQALNMAMTTAVRMK
jgi:hypothetical protein